MTMDTSKLEKMKVAELRNELQLRGLDTKGVKAVLIERLKAAIDNKAPIAEGGSSEITEISTPSRRSRRTRSMTRSPSPSPVKKTEPPKLEPLVEEEKVDTLNSEVEENKSEDQAQESPVGQNEQTEIASSNEAEPEEIQEDTAQADSSHEADEPDEAMPEEQPASDADEQNQEDTQANVSDSQAETVEKSTSEDAEMAAEKCEKPADEKMEVDSEQKESPKKDRDTKPDEKDRHIDKKEKRHSRKRSHSHSRSRSKSRSRSISRSRSRSRSKNSRSRSPKVKKDESINEEDEPVIEDKQFGLSWVDSDLHLTIDPVTFTSAKPMSQEIYSLVWSGARTNYGVREGKVCYEVRLAEETNVNQFKDEPFIRGLRCGFSTTKTGLLVGEDENSFAYCESGKKALNGEFVDYGKPFKLDDVIGCYLDLESTPCTIQFTVNGEEQGTAFEFNKEVLGDEDALYPHILTKGYEVALNFADSENLLGNVERPKRMRKKEKPRKESTRSEDANTKEASNTEDNWEVVDEAKMDDAENEDDKEKESLVNDNVDEKKEVVEGGEEKKEEEVKDDEEKIEEEKDNGEEKKEEVKEPTEDESEETPKKEEAEEKPESEAQESEEKKSEPAKIEDQDKDDEKKEDSKENGHNKPSETKKKSRESKDSEQDYEMEEVEPEERKEVFLLPGYELIALIAEEKFISGPQRPESRKECEVYLLVGLPGAGKTHWALNHIKENPEKRFHTIGADNLISKMTIDGKPRKPLHKGSWDRVYELCLQSLSALEEIATKRRRNFIIDQTNAFASAQRRKMKGFGDFKRTAVVCIPSEDELKKRNQLKTEAGTENTIRESTLNNLKASFTLPSLEFGWFDNIIFTDLKDDEAKDEVKRYNEKGSKDIDASREKRARHDNNRPQRDNRRRYDDRRRDDYRNPRWKGNSNDRRGGSGNRWGPPNRGSSGQWRDDRGYGGGGGRSYDNRSNRYSSGGSQNWVNNNRNRYDDRYGGRSNNGSGGGRSYDSYGSGGGSRDYRDRGRDRNGDGGDSGSRRDGGYRSGGNNQRDFRSGHRDNRIEDSRGGFERSKYPSTDDSYSYNKPSGHQTNTSSQGKWAQMQGGGNWGGQQQIPQQQQQYWSYDQTQAYGNQQQQQAQWPVNSADPRQQQWVNWYQNSQQQHPQGNAMPDNANQYWSQYSYPNQDGTTAISSHAPVDGSLKK